jgi:cytochrome c556
MFAKYNILIFKYILFISTFVILSLPANSELSVEEVIKGRKALFSKNYSTAKRVQTLATKGEFDKAKTLMLEMSENYKILIEYFPENSKEGFKTEALPTIWENKKEFNDLMIKSSNDMIELTKVIEGTDDIGGTIRKFMWSNCKSCHQRFREEH